MASYLHSDLLYHRIINCRHPVGVLVSILQSSRLAYALTVLKAGKWNANRSVGFLFGSH